MIRRSSNHYLTHEGCIHAERIMILGDPVRFPSDMRRNSTVLVSFAAFLVCVAFSVVAGVLVLHGSDDQHNHVTLGGQRIELTAAEASGRTEFAQKSGACHQLAASNTAGNAGANLDDVQPTTAQVEQVIENGQVSARGDMPSNLAVGPQIADIAQYVSRVASHRYYKP